MKQQFEKEKISEREAVSKQIEEQLVQALTTKDATIMRFLIESRIVDIVR